MFVLALANYIILREQNQPLIYGRKQNVITSDLSSVRWSMCWSFQQGATSVVRIRCWKTLSLLVVRSLERVEA